MIKKIYLDPYIFIGISLLAMVGVLILFSASEGDTTIVFKQSIYVVLGLILFLFVSQPDPDIYRRFSPLILFGTLVLVFVAYFFGPEINGARRWIRLFGFSFQPSELLKISLPLFLASFLFDKKLPINAKQTAISIFFILACFLSVYIQPDLGTGLLIAASGFLVLFLAGLSWVFIGITIAAILIFSPFIWNNLLEPFSGPLSAKIGFQFEF